MACYNQKSNYKKISCVMSFLRIIHGTNYFILFKCTIFLHAETGMLLCSMLDNVFTFRFITVLNVHLFVHYVSLPYKSAVILLCDVFICLQQRINMLIKHIKEYCISVLDIKLLLLK